MKNEELNIQSKIVNYLRMEGVLCFHVPNGTNVSNVRTRSLLKRSGLMSGVSDLIIVLKNRVVFVEVKTKKGRQSENQEFFQNQVQTLGFEYYIWRDLQQAIDFIEEIKKV